VPKDQKDHIPLLLDLIPLACAALAIVGLIFGTGVVLLGHQADIPLKPGISGANVSSILIARPQSDVLLPELSVGSIAAKAAANPTLAPTLPLSRAAARTRARLPEIKGRGRPIRSSAGRSIG
jgi:hypothetical protein